MITTIANDCLTVSVDSSGAELQNLQAGGTEFLWQGDPTFWGRRSPILFPIIGRLSHDALRIRGKQYPMTQHGFARDSEFALIEQSESLLRYQLKGNTKTLMVYPFRFTLDLVYSITDYALQIDLQIHNTGRELMPFSIGAHPAFSLAWCEEDKLTDYYLQFPQLENVERMFLEDGLISDRVEPFLQDEDTIDLGESLFDEDAIIMHGFQSENLTLRHRQSDQSLSVEFPKFTHLGVWSKPGAPFVCIEPWIGHADLAGWEGDFFHKRGTMKLAPQEWFTCFYRILVNPA